MPRAARVLVLLAALVVALLVTPAHAGGTDAREHRRTTPSTTQPTVEAYAVPVRRRVTYSVTTRGRPGACREPNRPEELGRWMQPIQRNAR